MLYVKLLANGNAQLAKTLIKLNIFDDLPEAFASYQIKGNKIGCFTEAEQHEITDLADDLEITYNIEPLTWDSAIHTMIYGDAYSKGATFADEAAILNCLVRIDASAEEAESKSEVTYTIVAPPFISTIYVVVHAALTEGWLSNTALDIPLTNGEGTKVFNFGLPNTYRLEFTCHEFGSSNEKTLLVVPESNPTPPVPDFADVLQNIQAENEQLKQRLQASESAILFLMDLA
jgi:hypothetical protein